MVEDSDGGVKLTSDREGQEATETVKPGSGFHGRHL